MKLESFEISKVYFYFIGLFIEIFTNEGKFVDNNSFATNSFIIVD